MDFWICFPSRLSRVGAEMGHGRKNITLCILFPSAASTAGGTLGVFPIWENYAILRKLCNFANRETVSLPQEVAGVSSRNIWKLVFEILADGRITLKCFCWISPPSPPRLYFLINGCQGRWAQAEFMHGRICRFLSLILIVFKLVFLFVLIFEDI